MPQENLSVEIGQPLSIDAVEQFSQRVNSLLNLLANFNKIPVKEGSVVKTYKTTVTLNNEPVPPGAVIPLSEVKREVAGTHEMVFDKKKKAVPVESVQKYGTAQVVKNDRALLNAIQKDVRSELIGNLADGTGEQTAESFQQLIARNTAAVRVAFDEDDPSVVSFVNTFDAYDYLGEANITTQSAFGMSYIENFMDNDIVFLSSEVPQGTIYSTASENLNFYYADVEDGAIGEFFNFTTNEDGFIGVMHSINEDRLTLETTTLFGILWLPERLDGIIVGTIVEPEPEPEPEPEGEVTP